MARMDVAEYDTRPSSELTSPPFTDLGRLYNVDHPFMEVIFPEDRSIGILGEDGDFEILFSGDRYSITLHRTLWTHLRVRTAMRSRLGVLRGWAMPLSTCFFHPPPHKCDTLDQPGTHAGLLVIAGLVMPNLEPEAWAMIRAACGMLVDISVIARPEFRCRWMPCTGRRREQWAVVSNG
ncbi:hypothetical protein RhiLY_10567 [Ceratobasidium sp. AG-Ba]|nr:hypothetical protein RhiLY_10567 [Ceratobasidium sp. AG-Ba]